MYNGYHKCAVHPNLKVDVESIFDNRTVDIPNVAAGVGNELKRVEWNSTEEKHKKKKKKSKKYGKKRKRLKIRGRSRHRSAH